MYLVRMCVLVGFFFSFGCNFLKISSKSNCSVVPFRISVALLIFCLEAPSIDISGALKYPSIVFPPVSLCHYLFSVFGCFCMGHMLMGVIPSPCVIFLSFSLWPLFYLI